MASSSPVDDPDDAWAALSPDPLSPPPNSIGGGGGAGGPAVLDLAAMADSDDEGGEDWMASPSFSAGLVPMAGAGSGLSSPAAVEDPRLASLSEADVDVNLQELAKALAVVAVKGRRLLSKLNTAAASVPKRTSSWEAAKRVYSTPFPSPRRYRHQKSGSTGSSLTRKKTPRKKGAPRGGGGGSGRRQQTSPKRVAAPAAPPVTQPSEAYTPWSSTSSLATRLPPTLDLPLDVPGGSLSATTSPVAPTPTPPPPTPPPVSARSASSRLSRPSRTTPSGPVRSAVADRVSPPTNPIFVLSLEQRHAMRRDAAAHRALMKPWKSVMR